MLRRINQVGSIISFAFIGAILSIGLVFFIYTLNQRSQQVRKELAAVEYERKQTSKNLHDNSLINSNNKSTVTTRGEVGVSSSVSADSSIELPLTGPAFSLVNFISLFFVTFYFMSYVLSQKHRSQPL